MGSTKLTGSILVFVLTGIFIGPALWRMALEITDFLRLPFYLPVYIVDLPPIWSRSGLTSIPNLICIVIGFAAAVIRYKATEPFTFYGAKLLWFLLCCLVGAFNFFKMFFGWLSQKPFYESHKEILDIVWTLILPWGFVTGYAPLFFDVTFSTLIWCVPFFVMYRLYLKDKTIAI